MGVDWDQLARADDGGRFAAPLILDPSAPEDQTKLAGLLKGGNIRHISDDYEEEQRELYAIMHPDRVYAPGFEEEFKAYYANLGDILRHGRWVYFPWGESLSHILAEEDFFKVRTARNRNLITADEQKKFYDSRIGIAGLSVGSSVAFAIVLQGGSRRLKLADMDRLALSNTNRILASVDELGERKVEIAGRRIYEINPFARIETFPAGLQEDNLDQFFDGLDLVIDEIDNLAVKCLIREQAKKRRVPVLMAADNGDNAVVDIERYDIDPSTPFFHGRMGEVSYDILKKLTKFETGRLIAKLVGPENATQRMQESLLEMGKTIVSWPQLGGAALINGAAVAYCARKIVTGEPLEQNRAFVSLDEKLDETYHLPEEIARRSKAAKDFASRLGI